MPTFQHTRIRYLLPLGVDCLTFGVKSLRIDEFIAAGTDLLAQQAEATHSKCVQSEFESRGGHAG